MFSLSATALQLQLQVLEVAKHLLKHLQYTSIYFIYVYSSTFRFWRLLSISSKIYNIHKYTSYMYTAPPLGSGGRSTSPQISTIYINILHLCIQLHLHVLEVAQHLLKYLQYTQIFFIFVYSSTSSTGGCQTSPQISTIYINILHIRVCI